MLKFNVIFCNGTKIVEIFQRDVYPGKKTVIELSQRALRAFSKAFPIEFCLSSLSESTIDKLSIEKNDFTNIKLPPILKMKMINQNSIYHCLFHK